MFQPVGQTRNRLGIGGLVLSAAGLVTIVMHEGYTSTAVIPVKGDRPTIGFGTANGVKMGDKTNPQAALQRSLADVESDEYAIKKCVTVPLYQYEYDAYVDFSYNIGEAAFCHSTLVKKLNAEDYAGACNEMLTWVYLKGKVIDGLVNRRQQEVKQCLGG